MLRLKRPIKTIQFLSDFNQSEEYDATGCSMTCETRSKKSFFKSASNLLPIINTELEQKDDNKKVDDSINQSTTTIYTLSQLLPTQDL